MPEQVGKKVRVLKESRQGAYTAAPTAYYWWPLSRTRIRQAALKVASILKPDKIVLFGSFAHGHPGPESDVDLLIVMETQETPHARVMRVSEILYPRPFPVDILVRTPAELEASLRAGDPFYQEILDKGIVLFERSSEQHVIARSEATKQSHSIRQIASSARTPQKARGKQCAGLLAMTRHARPLIEAHKTMRAKLGL